MAPVHASSPTISNATVVNHQTSLTLPSGGQIYISAVATDGSSRTSYFANYFSYLESPRSIVNMAGNPVSGVPGLVMDASNSNSGSRAIMIGHVYASGRVGYVVTMVSSQCAAGQNPNNAADLLMTFVFLPR